MTTFNDLPQSFKLIDDLGRESAPRLIIWRTRNTISPRFFYVQTAGLAGELDDGTWTYNTSLGGTHLAWAEGALRIATGTTTVRTTVDGSAVTFSGVPTFQDHLGAGTTAVAIFGHKRVGARTLAWSASAVWEVLGTATAPIYRRLHAVASIAGISPISDIEQIGTALVAIGGNATVVTVRSVDAGATWAAAVTIAGTAAAFGSGALLAAHGWLLAVVWSAAQTALIRVYRSVDGASWTATTGVNENFTWGIANHNNRVLVLGTANVQSSDDATNTLTAVPALANTNAAANIQISAPQMASFGVKFRHLAGGSARTLRRSDDNLATSSVLTPGAGAPAGGWQAVAVRL